MHYALRTLYFPAMNALFLKRQLTDDEDRDLAVVFPERQPLTAYKAGRQVFSTPLAYSGSEYW